MLSPEDRRLYSDCLEPPEGYRFDSGVATSFTLSLETLLVLPFTLAMKRATEPEVLLADPVALLEALRETSDRLAIFCHDGFIAVPPKRQLLYSYLEDCVIPARAEHERGIFHPKLWLLRFVDDDDHPLLRAVVLSRNLTFDRAWDTVVCLEGEPTRRRTRDSYGLADLVDALPGLAVRAPDPGRREIIERLADEARHTRFAAPEPFKDYARFHAIGVGGRAFEPAIDGWGSHVLCVSPFLSASAIDAAGEHGRESWTLISREDQLNACSPDTLERWTRYQLADDVETGDDADASETADDTVRGTATPSGLHAKLFVVEDGQGRVTWWIGSANLTGAAWQGRNVELMVELRGARRHVGIDAFLDGGFHALLEEHQRAEPDPDAAEQQRAIDLADQGRRALVDAQLELSCEPSGDAYDLTLQGAVDLPDGVTVRVWPLSLSETTHSRPIELPLTWPSLAPASLTTLLAAEVKATPIPLPGGPGEARTPPTATICFTLKLAATGLPDDRHAHILRQLIDSRAGFFRYLRFLLAAAGHEPIAELLRGEANGAPTKTRANLLDLEHAVLEDLLRATSRDPARLDAIERLLADLSKTDEGRALIPPDFEHLFDTLRQARPATGRRR